MFTSESIQIGVLGHRVGRVADSMKGKHDRDGSVLHPKGDYQAKCPFRSANLYFFVR